MCNGLRCWANGIVLRSRASSKDTSRLHTKHKVPYGSAREDERSLQFQQKLYIRHTSKPALLLHFTSAFSSLLSRRQGGDFVQRGKGDSHYSPKHGLWLTSDCFTTLSARKQLRNSLPKRKTPKAANGWGMGGKPNEIATFVGLLKEKKKRYVIAMRNSGFAQRR